MHVQPEDIACQQSLLDEIDQRQDELLDQLDQLNARVEQLLREYTGREVPPVSSDN
jgi:hypothetical protein